MRHIAVSIVCNTYNHERYIRQALCSFINQKTDFPFEVLVHDDASTDHTPDIIREFEDRYPDIVKPYFQTENQISKSVKISYKYQFPRAAGKYIAMCEGDDYWCDDHKLQRQYDIMEKYESCSMCVHRVRMVEEDGTPLDEFIPEIPLDEGMLSSEQAIEQIFIPERYQFQTSSYFFRSEYVKEICGRLPGFLKMAKVGDTPLMMYLATKGNFYYLDAEMSHYRVGSVGSWHEIYSENENLMVHYEKYIECLNAFNDYTEGKYFRYIEPCLVSNELHLHITRKEYRKLLAPRYRGLIRTYLWRYRLFIHLCAYFPWVDSLYARYKKWKGARS